MPKSKELRYGPPESDISHDKTEVQVTVRGKPTKLKPGGEDEQLVPIARVVLTQQGTSQVVSGGEGQSITSRELGLIAGPDVKKKFRNTRRRAREEEKRKAKARDKKTHSPTIL